ncbi:roadblock/LC7 domain-containing protein [Micromonospora sp. WMMD1082]|uniref:roadblock/LC7 domain-containing protein n=1 Tax=Micromonospora sp. WMMD1082 TaxID=3016104 RepID=UPI002417190B|nr:roadblock/LC7 domain-containing protein [Micromonospora sp. WMMD1082]MDG4795503.1 roadblock/LC7 domain-containing protein [Micromonospora sp. WMMD1082]
MNDLSFLMMNNLSQVPGVSHGVAVSADGMLLAWTEGLNREAAERLAAVTAGLCSLLKGAAHDMEAGRVQGNVTNAENGFLVLTEMNHGASLLVLAHPRADLAYVVEELGRFAETVRNQLGPSFASARLSPVATAGPR